MYRGWRLAGRALEWRQLDGPADAPACQRKGRRTQWRVVHVQDGMHCGGVDSATVVAGAWRWSSAGTERAGRFELSRNPAGAKGGGFGAVSCTSTKTCVAVGSLTNSAGTRLTLAESSTRTRWSMHTSPNPTGFADTALASVSCPSPTTCIAIGTLNGYQAELTEVWNGTTWTRYLTSNPIGTPFYTIKALSCASAVVCVAVGEAGKTAQDTDMRPLAERWNGSTWTVQRTPTPPGTAQSAFTGVSCASITACTAVGYSVNGANEGLALAEGWNGTSWTIQSTPNPPGTGEAPSAACHARRSRPAPRSAG